MSLADWTLDEVVNHVDYKSGTPEKQEQFRATWLNDRVSPLIGRIKDHRVNQIYDSFDKLGEDGYSPSEIEAVVNNSLHGEAKGTNLDNLKRASIRAVAQLQRQAGGVIKMSESPLGFMSDFSGVADRLNEIGKSTQMSVQFGLSEEQRQDFADLNVDDLLTPSWWFSEGAETVLGSIGQAAVTPVVAGTGAVVGAKYGGPWGAVAGGAAGGVVTEPLLVASASYAEALDNGLTPEEAKNAAWKVFRRQIGPSALLNAAQGGLAGFFAKKLVAPKAAGAFLRNASRVGAVGAAGLATAPTEGIQEVWEQGSINTGIEYARELTQARIEGREPEVAGMARDLIIGGYEDIIPAIKDENIKRNFLAGSAVGFFVGSAGAATQAVAKRVTGQDVVDEHNARVQKAIDDFKNENLTTPEMVDRIKSLKASLDNMSDEQIRERAVLQGSTQIGDEDIMHVKESLIESEIGVQSEKRALQSAEIATTDDVSVTSDIEKLTKLNNELQKKGGGKGDLTIQPIIPDADMQANLDEASKIINKPVVMVVATDSNGNRHPLSTEGFHFEDSVVVDASTVDKLIADVVKHEMTHELQAKSPQVYQKLVGLAAKYAGGFNEWIAIRNARAKELGRNEIDPASNEASAEFVADFAAEYSSNEDVMEEIDAIFEEFKQTHDSNPRKVTLVKKEAPVEPAVEAEKTTQTKAKAAPKAKKKATPPPKGSAEASVQFGTPNWIDATIEFDSDIDKAIFVATQSNKKNQGDSPTKKKAKEYLRARGVRWSNAGMKIRNELKKQYESGSRELKIASASKPKPKPKTKAKPKAPAKKVETVDEKLRREADEAMAEAMDEAEAQEESTPAPISKPSRSKTTISESGAEIKGITISSDTATIESRDIGDGVLQVFNVKVDEDMRNKGIGTDLYNMLIIEAKKDGYHTIVSDNSVSKIASKIWNALGAVKSGAQTKTTLNGSKRTVDGSPLYSLIISESKSTPAPSAKKPVQSVSEPAKASSAPSEKKAEPQKKKPTKREQNKRAAEIAKEDARAEEESGLSKRKQAILPELVRLGYTDEQIASFSDMSAENRVRTKARADGTKEKVKAVPPPSPRKKVEAVGQADVAKAKQARIERLSKAEKNDLKLLKKADVVEVADFLGIAHTKRHTKNDIIQNIVDSRVTEEAPSAQPVTSDKTADEEAIEVQEAPEGLAEAVDAIEARMTVGSMSALFDLIGMADPTIVGDMQQWNKLQQKKGKTQIEKKHMKALRDKIAERTRKVFGMKKEEKVEPEPEAKGPKLLEGFTGSLDDIVIEDNYVPTEEELSQADQTSDKEFMSFYREEDIYDDDDIGGSASYSNFMSEIGRMAVENLATGKLSTERRNLALQMLTKEGRDIERAIMAAEEELGLPEHISNIEMQKEASLWIDKNGGAAKLGDDLARGDLKFSGSQVALGAAVEIELMRIHEASGKLNTPMGIYKAMSMRVHNIASRSDIARALQYGRDLLQDPAERAHHYAISRLTSLTSKEEKQIENAKKKGDKDKVEELIKKAADRSEAIVIALVDAGIDINDKSTFKNFRKTTKAIQIIEAIENASINPLEAKNVLNEVFVSSILYSIKTVGANVMGIAPGIIKLTMLKTFTHIVAGEGVGFMSKEAWRDVNTVMKILTDGKTYQSMARYFSEGLFTGADNFQFEELGAIGEQQSTGMTVRTPSQVTGNIRRLGRAVGKEKQFAAVGDKLQVAVSVPTRAIVSVDSPMRYLFHRLMTAWESIHMLRKMGIKENDIPFLTQYFVENPHTEPNIQAANMIAALESGYGMDAGKLEVLKKGLRQRGMKEANFLLFQDRDTAAARAANKATAGRRWSQSEHGIGWGLAGAWIRLMFPFVSTPANLIATSILELTPLKLATTATKIANTKRVQIASKANKLGAAGTAAKFFTPELGGTGGYEYASAYQAREDVVQSLAVAGGWFALIAAVKGLLDDDDNEFDITGSSPSDFFSGEASFKREARPPMSVKFAGIWWSYARLDPFATDIAMAVDFAEASNRGDHVTTVEKYKEIADRIGGQIHEKAFLRNVSDMIKVLSAAKNAEDGYLRYYGLNVATSFVPAFIRHHNIGSDAKAREHSIALTGEKGESVWGKRWRQRSLRATEDSAPVKVDWLGRDIDKAGFSEDAPVSNFVAGLVQSNLPLYTKKVEDSGINKMITEWNQKANDEERYYPVRPRKSVQLDGETVQLTEGEYTSFMKTRGSRIIKSFDSYSRFSKLDIDKPTQKNMDWLEKKIESIHKSELAKLKKRVEKRVKQQ